MSIIVVCEHGCGICGEMWKHIPSAHGSTCPDAGKVNRVCPPCQEKERLERAAARANESKVKRKR